MEGDQVLTRSVSIGDVLAGTVVEIGRSGTAVSLDGFAGDVGSAVLVVEDNGFHGTDQAVLSAASAEGRAASMFWNVNAVTRLSFAEGGQVLASFEPCEGQEHHLPALNDALTGLDFADYDERIGKGLVAVERFTGYGITAADLANIRDLDVGYRVLV